MKKLISKLYGNLAFFRRKLYKKGILKKKSLDVPVISIGNLSVGGTGKTPVTISTAKGLQKRGFNVCVLSRGYKRKSKGVVIVSDGKEIFVDVKTAGDEPFLIAKNGIPIVVGESRYKAGLKALKTFPVDIFIIDDGFQHYQLERDVDILVVDAARPFWKDNLLPSGRLREPKQFSKYADAFVVTKLFLLDEKKKQEFFYRLSQYAKPYFSAKEKFVRFTDGEIEYSFDIMVDVDVGIFAGLGNNDQFFRYMIDCAERCGFRIKYTKSFPDHYDYKKLELYNDVDFWITTYKDFLKLSKNQIKRSKILALMYDIELPEEYFEYLEKKIYNRKERKLYGR